MEVIKGTASRVRHSSEVTRNSNDNSTSTTYVSLFFLGPQQVKIRSNEPSAINENDIIAVAGKIRGKFFNAYAYKNITCATEGNEGLWMNILFGIIAPVVGLSGYSAFSDPSLGAGPKLISLAFVTVGLYMLFKATRVLKAIKLLKPYN
ncbi:hypothetical protein [Marinagarivorans cellulosilyticus]|uniref:Uncharacterized protein n=1 Tax=Marinagarivorans cellulosilyticus TaxID=2721545 RepID=A0AAN1WE68_9GAMM|nr:hypothetical protein [Marinagarivorans cellulosilyticus]BCD95947.1 hypothetical protein MARGE09_P0146 [Marinagarivorans cellulosilyticus]